MRTNVCINTLPSLTVGWWARLFSYFKQTSTALRMIEHQWLDSYPACWLSIYINQSAKNRRSTPPPTHGGGEVSSSTKISLQFHIENQILQKKYVNQHILVWLRIFQWECHQGELHTDLNVSPKDLPFQQFPLIECQDLFFRHPALQRWEWSSGFGRAEVGLTKPSPSCLTLLEPEV